jgi:hypothetical protein
MRAGSISATPAQPLRRDVTELVRQWAEHRERFHGLAVLASGDGPGHACFTTGLTWGRGPRIEAYLLPPKKKSGDAGLDDGGADGGDGGDGGDDEDGGRGDGGAAD